jgi:AraC family cel operon transcriptional repressor
VVLKQTDILFADGFHVAETILGGNARTFIHSHDFYEVFLVTSGQVYQRLNGSEELLGEGCLYFIHPEDTHCFRTANTVSAAFVNLAFSPELYRLATGLFDSYTRTESAENRLPVPGARTVRLPALLRESIYFKLLYPSCGLAGIFKLARRDILLGTLLDCFCFLRGQGAGESAAPAWLVRAYEAMRKDHNYVWGIRRFVELSGKTQEHLTRSMKKYYTITPSAYINGLRIGEAARLLKTSGLSVLGIQLECGFGNTAHFNMLFRAEFGISPSRYRRLNRAVITEAMK